MPEEMTTAQNDEMRIYELAFLVSPFVSEESAAAFLTSIQEKVAKNGGAVISSGEPRLRQLAYEISHRVEGKKQVFDKGYFGWVKFEILPEAAVKVDESVKEDPSVMRSMMILTVREDTFIPRESTEHFGFVAEGGEDEEGGDEHRDESEDEERGPVDEEEINKTIEELVIE